MLTMLLLWSEPSLVSVNVIGQKMFIQNLNLASTRLKSYNLEHTRVWIYWNMSSGKLLQFLIYKKESQNSLLGLYKLYSDVGIISCQGWWDPWYRLLDVIRDTGCCDLWRYLIMWLLFKGTKLWNHFVILFLQGSKRSFRIKWNPKPSLRNNED